MTVIAFTFKFAKASQEEELAFLWVSFKAFPLIAFFSFALFRDMFEKALMPELAKAGGEVLADRF